jgi:hypothetical protein
MRFNTNPFGSLKRLSSTAEIDLVKKWKEASRGLTRLATFVVFVVVQRVEVTDHLKQVQVRAFVKFQEIAR